MLRRILQRPGWPVVTVLLVASGCYTPGDPFIDLDTGVEGGLETGLEPGGSPLRTYWISETTNFSQSSSPDCDNTSLNNVGSLAAAMLQDDGWTGTYVVNGETTRRDFADGTVFPGGQDHVAADTAALAIYAGHGWVNGLQWGNPDAQGLCEIFPSSGVRLGRANGDVTRLAVFVTSCTMNVPQLYATVGLSSAGQYTGWHNSPAVSDFVLASFYDTTNFMIEDGDPLSNRLSWMSVGQSKPGLGKNSPVIFTEQGDDADVQNRHFGARISAGTGIDAVLPEVPGDNRRVTWIDNGECP